jgi:hypothetical protein
LGWRHETIQRCKETISRCCRRRPETADGYRFDNKNGGQRRQAKAGDSQMRTLSFILAFAFVAGSSDSGLPGVGTFAYSGPPIAGSQAVVLATR